MKSGRLQSGSAYSCRVCKAEVSVIRAGIGSLMPFCCNEPMRLNTKINPAFSCKICKAEIMVIKGIVDNLLLICCGKEMKHVVV